MKALPGFASHGGFSMNQSLPPSSAFAAEELPRRKFTVAEVEAMGQAGILEEDERLELVDGELILMSPKGSRHEILKISLNDRWCRARPESCRLAPETTFRLSTDTYLEPDFVVYPRAVGLKNISGPNVLLVVEVADSSLRYDQGRKAALYARFGIRELWVIDAVTMTIRAFRSPSPEGFSEVADHAASERVVPRFAPGEFALALEELELDGF
jgi:Uma2 family endonuclease